MLWESVLRAGKRGKARNAGQRFILGRIFRIFLQTLELNLKTGPSYEVPQSDGLGGFYEGGQICTGDCLFQHRPIRQGNEMEMSVIMEVIVLSSPFGCRKSRKGNTVCLGGIYVTQGRVDGRQRCSGRELYFA